MEYFANLTFNTAVRVTLIVVIGFPIIWILSRLASRAFSGHTSRHVRLLVGNIIFYGGCAALIMAVLHQVGFQPSALLGAAGIVGIAFGFAAQTSMANFISGIFLLLEHPFVVGDTIEYEKVVGKVELIDLLSVRIRTDDNKLVRIPNEALIKNKVTNMTYFTVMCLKYKVQIPETTQVHQLLKLIPHILDRHPSLFLQDPAPYIQVEQLSGLVATIKVQVWTPKDKIITASRELVQGIFAECQQRSIPVAIAPSE